MLKFLAYLALFYLVYKWFVQPLFLSSGSAPNSIKDSKPDGKGKEDEYIDYEEVD